MAVAHVCVECVFSPLIFPSISVTTLACRVILCFGTHQPPMVGHWPDCWATQLVTRLGAPARFQGRMFVAGRAFFFFFFSFFPGHCRRPLLGAFPQGSALAALEHFYHGPLQLPVYGCRRKPWSQQENAAGHGGPGVKQYFYVAHFVRPRSLGCCSLDFWLRRIGNTGPMFYRVAPGVFLALISAGGILHDAGPETGRSWSPFAGECGDGFFRYLAQRSTNSRSNSSHPWFTSTLQVTLVDFPASINFFT